MSLNTTILFQIYRSDLNSLQFQLTFSIPKISATAHYRSSGVLIMVQATGGGEYWGEYGKISHTKKNYLKKTYYFIFNQTLYSLQRALKPKYTLELAK